MSRIPICQLLSRLLTGATIILLVATGCAGGDPESAAGGSLVEASDLEAFGASDTSPTGSESSTVAAEQPADGADGQTSTPVSAEDPIPEPDGESVDRSAPDGPETDDVDARDDRGDTGDIDGADASSIERPEGEAAPVGSARLFSIPTDSLAIWGSDAPWPQACDREPTEQLVGLDLVESTPERPEFFNMGAVHRLTIVDVAIRGTRVAMTAQCEGFTEAEILFGRLNPTGTITMATTRDAATDSSAVVAPPGGSVGFGGAIEGAYGLEWIDDSTVQFFTAVDEGGEWRYNQVSLDIISGELSGTPFVDDGVIDTQTWVDPEGRTYATRSTAKLGCEGIAQNQTLVIVGETQDQPALRDPDRTFSYIADMHFGTGGFVAWTSVCEDFVTIWVARQTGDGSLIEVHTITPRDLGDGDSLQNMRPRRIRATSDGKLVVVGVSSNQAGTAPIAAIYEPMSDPAFLTQNGPGPTLADSPIHTSFDGRGWYVGTTTASEPSCGETTLYSSSEIGLERVLPSDQELDHIADLDVSAATDDRGLTARAIVVSTECRTERLGRQLWWAVEYAATPLPLRFLPVSTEAVADVSGVWARTEADGTVTWFADITEQNGFTASVPLG